jgi:predicted flap endonuclease-1-like 5' DNA nuclease
VNLILLLIGAAALFALGFALGHRRAGPLPPSTVPPAPAAAPPLPGPEVASAPAAATARPASGLAVEDGVQRERVRLVRSYEAETAAARQGARDREASIVQLEALAQDRRLLLDAVAQSRAETARYRQWVIDIENNAPPVLFGTAAPDDLKLIVGVGPVLERMLHQLGVTTYRQIARWSERDIDEFDARLAEFPGLIRRDGWVTQARELHQSKYGETIEGGARW